MSRLEKLVSDWKFKKVFIVYLITALVLILAMAVTTGIVFRDRLSFAYNFQMLQEKAEKQTPDELKSRASVLAQSDFVTDIILLDKSNSVAWSAKGSAFKEGPLELTKSENDKNYLVSSDYPDAVFRIVDEEEFMLGTIISKDFGKYEKEYDDESFYRPAGKDKEVYLISHVKAKRMDYRVLIISKPEAVTNGMMLLKAEAALLMLLFMIYWVLVALAVFQNASKAKLYPYFWGLITLLTNLAGVLIYALYKNGNETCPECGTSQSRAHLYCAECGLKLSKTCTECGKAVAKKDKFCTHCGKALN